MHKPCPFGKNTARGGTLTGHSSACGRLPYGNGETFATDGNIMVIEPGQAPKLPGSMPQGHA